MQHAILHTYSTVDATALQCQHTCIENMLIFLVQISFTSTWISRAMGMLQTRL